MFWGIWVSLNLYTILVIKKKVESHPHTKQKTTERKFVPNKEELQIRTVLENLTYYELIQHKTIQQQNPCSYNDFKFAKCESIHY